jgi:transcriptional regulator with XRE-family HTH domain
LQLAEILYQRRISQAKLARMADMNLTDLNAMLHGRRPTFPGWRRRIAQALNMPESEVFPEISQEVVAQ